MENISGAMARAEESHNHTVKIYIEKTSPCHTTGAALYRLGQVPADYVLFREMEGRRDDELVPKTDAQIHLKEWEHFYSAQAKLNPGSTER